MLAQSLAKPCQICKRCFSRGVAVFGVNISPQFVKVQAVACHITHHALVIQSGLKELLRLAWGETKSETNASNHGATGRIEMTNLLKASVATLALVAGAAQAGGHLPFAPGEGDFSWDSYDARSPFCNEP